MYCLFISRELVFQRVMAEINTRLPSERWQDRRTALTALIVITEYTSDLLRPCLHELLPSIRPFLADPNHAVRRKAAYVFSECAYYCEGSFHEAAPWVMMDIMEVLLL